MTSDVESQIIRVIGKLENAQPNLNLPPTTNETQEGNYRLQKKIAGILNQANITNISSFQNDLNENPNDIITEISNSNSEASSELMEPSFHKPNLNRRNSIILDLNKIINIGEYKIELGKLINILDKKLPDKKENNLSNDISKTYSQCSTEGNERRKSFLSPEKTKVSYGQSGSNTENKENSSESSNQMSKDENNCEDLSRDKKFDANLSKKYHKIALLLKVYMNENKLVNEMNKNGQKEINIPNNNCRRRSLFDMSSYIIPSETSTISGNSHQLPNFVSKFFRTKKGDITSKRKKRNSMVSGRLCNKLKKLNQQLQSQNTSKKAPQSEKAEFRIKQEKSEKATESTIKFNNENRKKSISEISNFNASNNASESIIDNENSVYDGNNSKRDSMIFTDGLSAVKKRRQSDFFDIEIVPQQQEEITGFHKMISTIIEEEDNNNINTNANVQNEYEKKENNVGDEKEEKSHDENEDSSKENKENENNENEGEESDDSDNVEEEEEDTILDDDYCYNENNISTSLCFDDCIF
jgi:hypothetical protein